MYYYKYILNVNSPKINPIPIPRDLFILLYPIDMYGEHTIWHVLFLYLFHILYFFYIIFKIF